MVTEKRKTVKVEGYWKYDKSIFVVDVVVFVRNKIRMDSPHFVYLTGTCNGFRWSKKKPLSNLVVKSDPAYLKLVKQTIRKKDDPRENGGTVMTNVGTQVCILRTGDYVVFKRDAENRNKCVNEKLSISLDNGTIKLIRGIKVGKVEWFITSVDNVGDFETINCRGMTIRGGVLIGQYGSTTNPLILQIKASDYDVAELFESIGKKKPQEAKSVATQSKEKIERKPMPKRKINLSTDLPEDSIVYLYSQKCHCSKCSSLYGKNTMENCTATVQTFRGGLVPVSVMFCTGCGTFFMNYDTYTAYNRKYGGLKFQCHVDRSDLQLKSDLGFAKDSFLSRAGYSVNANMPRPRRQGILANLIDDGKATKWEITEKISEFIRLGKKNPNMQDAIKRWEEDLAFVADYNVDKQAKVGRATFKQGGKITRR